jgi:virulence-associated protein VagC
MEALVINRWALPEPISSYIDSDRVEVSRENGRVVLSPVAETADDIKKRKREWKEAIKELHKMFSDGKMSSEDFIKQKDQELELENEKFDRICRSFGNGKPFTENFSM